MARENTKIGVLITLEDPSKPMRDEACAAGVYRHEYLGRYFYCIQIITVKEMIEKGKRLDLPLSLEVVKKAEDKRQAGKQEPLI